MSGFLITSRPHDHTTIHIVWARVTDVNDINGTYSTKTLDTWLTPSKLDVVEPCGLWILLREGQNSDKMCYCRKEQISEFTTPSIRWIRSPLLTYFRKHSNAKVMRPAEIRFLKVQNTQIVPNYCAIPRVKFSESIYPGVYLKNTSKILARTRKLVLHRDRSISLGMHV